MIKNDVFRILIVEIWRKMKKMCITMYKFSLGH